MTTEEYIIAGCVIGVILILGIVLFSGRGAWLIAGFNMLPRKEQERYDKRALCQFIGKFLFITAGAGVLVCASEVWPGYGLVSIGTAIILGSTAFVLVWINTGDRFRKK